MKQKIILAFFSVLICATAYSQKKHKTKCKLVHDKELNVDVYKNADCSEAVAENVFDNEVFQSSEFHFKNITKTYPPGQKVTIGYLIGTDGKAVFVKVLEPVNDKEIEEEAKRLINLMPIYKTCKCNGEPVSSTAKITLPLISKSKK